jgi:hypothetical protein
MQCRTGARSPDGVCDHSRAADPGCSAGRRLWSTGDPDGSAPGQSNRGPSLSRCPGESMAAPDLLADRHPPGDPDWGYPAGAGCTGVPGRSDAGAGRFSGRGVSRSVWKLVGDAGACGRIRRSPDWNRTSPPLDRSHGAGLDCPAAAIWLVGPSVCRDRDLLRPTVRHARGRVGDSVYLDEAAVGSAWHGGEAATCRCTHLQRRPYHPHGRRFPARALGDLLSRQIHLDRFEQPDLALPRVD